MLHPSSGTCWLKTITCVIAIIAAGLETGRAQESTSVPASEGAYESRIHPLIERYCQDCHAGDEAEGDIDLAVFRTLADVRTQTPIWLKVRQMLESGQMPPQDAPQPTDVERDRMRGWVRKDLAIMARAQAGDPGPVILRRLTNAEYNYTIRDLTGVDSLDPTHEFPVDGAAGEGFTNVGIGQGMSPALVRKYLNAAKQVASHVVLLPDGIRFSSKTSQRDHTNELLARIQQFYRRYTADGGGTTVNFDGQPVTTNQGGRLPVEDYLRATLVERDALQTGAASIEAVAADRKLNAKYLRLLWDMLADEGAHPSPLLDDLRRRWHSSSAAEARALSDHIAQWQSALWKFNSIGHIGREGGATAWMEPVRPITTSHELRLALPESIDGQDVTVTLAASDLDNGDAEEFVVWQRARMEFAAEESRRPHPPILLRDVRPLVKSVEQSLGNEVPRTADYLAALVTSPSSPQAWDDAATSAKLNRRLLANWAELTGIGQPASRDIKGHFTGKQTAIHGYEAVNGWGRPETPSLLTNRSDQAIQFATLTVPARGVTVHPSPSLDVAVVWRSPIDTRLQIEGLIADADNVCGNGGAWRVELRSATGLQVLADGVFENGGSHTLHPDKPLDLRTGDTVSLIVSARDGNHSCDTTHVNLTLSEIGGERKWDLAADVVDDVLQGNPLPDAYGHAETWHFCEAPASPTQSTAIVPESSLARWRAAMDAGDSPDDLHPLAIAVQNVLVQSDDGLSEPDRLLRRQLLDWRGPLDWLTIAPAIDEDTDSTVGLDPAQFGHHPDGATPDGAVLDEADLCLRAPHAIEVRLPAALSHGAELVATGRLHPESDPDGSVQLQLLTTNRQTTTPDHVAITSTVPVLVAEDSPAQRRISEVMDEFRKLFPPALCYAKIVPVDEVVTLTLFHREDEHLRRLMLDDAASAELDRLWDELLFVSEEPLKLVVAFEQISEFATQDRPDLVTAFASLRQPIQDRADAFRKRQMVTEPSHVEAVIDFAARAWRRPLSDTQRQDLQDIYNELRSSEIAHEESVPLLLARVLTAPAFLYKLEQPGDGQPPVPVSDLELATRLSYFLWSSLPDDELRQAAAAGRLTADTVLVTQTRRLLNDDRTRRLAIHFACQWLHLRDFDQQDDKNEQLFPEFASLRPQMYEETVRFFEDLFRNDRSILEILDADHTFLNGSLAGHYGIDGVMGDGWQRVDGVRASGRGGILGMATVLASQSGASRTSPILRGNWVSETLLGERLPKPPAGIPQLPETVPENLTARQLIERHSSAPECAKCHERIDPYGFALEQFDTIGRSRSEKADTHTKLMDGQQIDGLDGLRTYLVRDRRDDFVRQFNRKLLGYALGREVQLSDEPLLDEIRAKLEANDYRFSIAVEAIVTSRQFRDIRGREQDESSRH